MSLRERNAAFWNDPAQLTRIQQGVPALGGGGETEAAYRVFEEARTLRALVDFRPDDRVLEVGCGNGRWACVLAPRVRSYTGVDLSRPLIAQAREACAARGVANATFVEAAAEEFVPAERCSILYLSGMAQYLEDAALAALVTRLGGGARLLIDRSTFHATGRRTVSPDGYASIYRRFSEFVPLVERGGWRLAATRASYVYFSYPGRVTRWLARPFWRDVIGATRVVSYPFLRCSARLLQKRFRGSCGMTDYEHAFSIFTRPAEVGR